MAPKKAKAKAGAPKAKAAAAPAGPSKEELLAKEAKEQFDRFAEEGGGVKLKGFAECLRAVNTRKLNIWTDDEIGPKIIKSHWNALNKDKEISEADFVAWWPSFMEQVEAKEAEVAAAAEKEEAEKAAQVQAKADKYESTGVWNIPLKDLEEAVNEAWKRDKTPLIIDNTENFRSETYYTYNGAHIIEFKKLIVDGAKGTSVEDLLADVNKGFFGAKCFKFGQTALFRLANTAPDVQKFTNESFPAMALLNAAEVRKCQGADNAGNVKGTPYDKMCPNDDERGEITLMGIHEKYRTVVITQFQEDSYKEFLTNTGFPLDLCQPIKPFMES